MWVSARPGAWQIFREGVSSAVTSQGPGRAVGLCQADLEEEPLDRPPQVSAATLMEPPRETFEPLGRGVADAVNQAPPGQVINASEATVRDLLAGVRRITSQAAVPLRLQAQEAAAPPSEAPPDRPTVAEQGA